MTRGLQKKMYEKMNFDISNMAAYVNLKIQKQWQNVVIKILLFLIISEISLIWPYPVTRPDSTVTYKTHTE